MNFGGEIYANLDSRILDFGGRDSRGFGSFARIHGFALAAKARANSGAWGAKCFRRRFRDGRFVGRFANVRAAALKLKSMDF